MTATVTISCDIDSTDYACPLGLEIQLDGRTQWDISAVTQPVNCEFTLPDQDGQHELTFILKNKLPEHTKIDNTGQIIQDARIIIANLSFDGIPLGQIVNRLAEYHHDFNGHGAATVDRFYGEMGCNGQVRLTFSTPIYLWMLDHM